MKNEREIRRIVEFLNNFGISVHAPKRSDKFWYVHVTNRQNLEKLADLDIFALHPSRKKKLENLLRKYKRRQAIAFKKEARFLQISKILVSGGKTALDVSQRLGISLIRAQVLFKCGYDNGLFQRRRLNGSKTPYIYTIS